MMQDEVNKIVFNALADGREIWFPGVGSLVPEFRSAWRGQEYDYAQGTAG